MQVITFSYIANCCLLVLCVIMENLHLQNMDQARETIPLSKWFWAGMIQENTVFEPDEYMICVICVMKLVSTEAEVPGVETMTLKEIDVSLMSYQRPTVTSARWLAKKRREMESWAVSLCARRSVSEASNYLARVIKATCPVITQVILVAGSESS